MRGFQAARSLKDQRGQALMTVLAVASVVMMLITIILLNAGNEAKVARQNQAKQSLAWVGRSARAIVQERLMYFINGRVSLGIQLKAQEAQLINALVGNDPLRILEYADGITRQQSDQIRLRVDLTRSTDGIALDTGTAVLNNLDDDRQFDALITIRPDGAPHFSDTGQEYVYPFRFDVTLSSNTRLRAAAQRETVTGSGSMSLYLKRGSFCKYLLFMENTGGVYLTQNDAFDGPIHSNGGWNFVDNPGANCGGVVTQVSKASGFGAYTADADHWPPGEKNPNKMKVRPLFAQGFFRGMPRIELPNNMNDFRTGVLNNRQKKDMKSGDINMPGGDPPKGGLYISGDASVRLEQGDESQTYVIEQKVGNEQHKYVVTTSYKEDPLNNVKPFTSYEHYVNGSLSSQTTYDGVADSEDYYGLQQSIYIDGKITGLSGTVDSGTQLSICSSGAITIDGDIRYEDQSVNGKNNLGIISENNDIILDFGKNAAPQDVYIDAALMTPKGAFKVADKARNTPGLGSIFLKGSVVSRNLGATESGNCGYGLKSNFDPRLEHDPPPLFPKTSTFAMTMNTQAGICTMNFIWNGN